MSLVQESGVTVLNLMSPDQQRLILTKWAKNKSNARILKNIAIDALTEKVVCVNHCEIVLDLQYETYDFDLTNCSCLDITLPYGSCNNQKISMVFNGNIIHRNPCKFILKDSQETFTDCSVLNVFMGVTCYWNNSLGWMVDD